MKIRRTVALFLLLAFGVITLLLFLRKEERPVRLTEATQLQSNLLATGVPPQPIATNVAVEPRKAPTESEIATALASGWMNVPIQFWGKVVDENEKPIAGATISLHVRQWHPSVFLQPRGDFKNFERLTDFEGRFHVEGEKGDTLTVQSITKAGYELSAKAEKSFRYHVATNISPDPENPIIFRMWHLTSAEPLLTGKKFFRVVPDGRSYSVALSSPVVVSLGEVKSADLWLRLKRPENVSREDKYDWSFSIQAVQGGVIQTNSEFMYLAPISGYVSNFVHEARNDDSRWAHRIKRNFFFKTGSNFGRMDVEVFVHYDGGAAVEINFALNPSGSTNLRFDRNVQPKQTQFE
jgi:hypothetical protein